MDDLTKVNADLDNLDKIGANYLHQLDKVYEKEPKLNIGDIVSIKALLTNSTAQFDNKYKVVVTTTVNGLYGIVSVFSPSDLPHYFNRKELVLLHSADKEESFLYRAGDYVTFKLSSNSKPLTGLITARHSNEEYKTEPAVGGYWVTNKYYKIKTFDKISISQYEVHESDIIERLCTSTSESEQQKAVNMENSTEEPKIRIGDIVSVLLPRGPFDSSTVNQYKVKDIDMKTGKYRIVHVYTPAGPSEYYDRKDLILRRKADEKKPFLFQKGDIVSFKLLWCNDIRYGQIEEMLRAVDNCYKIRCLKDSCLYLVEESNIEKITYTAPDCTSVKPDTITGLTITKAESWSPIKTTETAGNIEEKPLNIKIVKKQIKLNFKN